MNRLCFSALAASSVLAGAALAQPCGGEFPGLVSDGLVLNGNAAFDAEGGRLIITTPDEGQTSSAFANFRPRVADGFRAEFTFRIQFGAADGFTFIIQDQGPAALGGGGSSLGYAGVSRALVFEIDTFSFGPPDEFPATHLAIHTACDGSVSDGDGDSIAHVVLSDLGLDVTDGEPHTCLIEYRGGALFVAIDDIPVVPDLAFDFENCGGHRIVSEDGCAYVGFTGATGAATALQTITAWTFDDDPPCVGADLGSFIDSLEAEAGGAVTFSFVGTGSPVLRYFWLLNGQAVEDGGPISGATTGTLTIDPVGPQHAGQWDYGVFNDCQGVSSGFTMVVIVPCVPDFNGDGNLDPDDLADAIGCYFDSFCPFDFNGDTNEDPDDLADYIAAYFGGC